MTKLTTIERIYLAILLIAFMVFSVFIPYVIAQSKISNVLGQSNAPEMKSMIGGASAFFSSYHNHHTFDFSDCRQNYRLSRHKAENFFRLHALYLFNFSIHCSSAVCWHATY
ncbi:hypothetical protein [Lactovum odontotermitis]